MRSSINGLSSVIARFFCKTRAKSEMNNQLRRAILSIQNMLCEVSDTLEGLPGDQFRYSVSATEDFLAGEILRMLGCKVEFYPDDREAFNRIKDATDPNEIKNAIVQGQLIITLPEDMSNA